MEKGAKPKRKKTKAASATSRTAPKSSRTQKSKKSPKKSAGTGLFEKNPLILDKRLPEQRRFEGVTPTQWKEYVNDLKCAVCGESGGKCMCKPDDLEKETGDVQKKLIALRNRMAH